MRLQRVSIATLLCVLPALACAQTPSPAPATVSAAEAKSIDETLEAFGVDLMKMDFNAFATLFTEDCDWVNIVGMHWHGKTQVVKAHSIVFTTRYRGVAMHTLESSRAMLRPGLALVISTVKLDDYTAQDGKAMSNNLFRITWLLEKQGERWLVRSGQNTIIDSEAAKHDPGQAH